MWEPWSASGGATALLPLSRAPLLTSVPPPDEGTTTLRGIAAAATCGGRRAAAIRHARLPATMYDAIRSCKLRGEGGRGGVRRQRCRGGRRPVLPVWAAGVPCTADRSAECFLMARGQAGNLAGGSGAAGDDGGSVAGGGRAG